MFLIEYSREEGQVKTFRTFASELRTQANEQRLQLEIDLNRQGLDREVVILEAPDEATLHRTHGRYFKKSIADLVESHAMALLAQVG